MATNDEVPPRIVLVPLSRSHPFNQRECTVSEPLKVGRPVDKKRISPNNLIFDCRVLSRNHALIWYENGKFFIQDTKSSNGTFVNDCRLSPSGEESTPRELSTRDIVQFGVNVNVDKRVTHGCIIATILLYVAGKELPGPDPDIQQVIQVVQNCLNKEIEFETKLVMMQEALNAAHSLAKESMINIVKEDELLSRLEMLENQLHVYSRNVGEDDLKRQLAKALEERHSNNMAAKAKVQVILQEKIDCTTRLSQVQRDYDKAEEECQKYRTLYEALKQEHAQQISKLNDQVKTAEKQKSDLLEKIKEEKDISLAEQNSIKGQLELVEGQLLEMKEKLFQANLELETNRQPNDDDNGRESPKSLPNSIPNDNISHDEAQTHVPNNENEDDRGRGTEVKDTILSSVEVTITPSIRDGNDDKLPGQMLTQDMLGETVDNGHGNSNRGNDSNTFQNILLAELEDQLTAEKEEKTSLVQKLEMQSKLLAELQDKLEEKSSDSSMVTITDEQLKLRETELLALQEEKTRLLSHVSSLERDNNQLEKECNDVKYELAQHMEKSKKLSNSMQERITSLQASLNSVKKDGDLSTPLDPLLPSSPDPRIKILSIITLVSIAVAMLSVTIAYFF